MSRHLTKEEAKIAFESQVNRAAKAIRAIAKIVEENPTHFETLTVTKTVLYLNNQVNAASCYMREALVAADPIHAPFSLDAEYAPMTEKLVVKMDTVGISSNQIVHHRAPDLALQVPFPNATTVLPPGARRKAVGRLVGTKGTETVFAINEPTARPMHEGATEKPDKTGAIRDAGFIDSE